MSSSSLAPQTTSLLEGGLDLHHTRLEVVHISHTDCVLACVFVCAYAWLCVCVCVVVMVVMVVACVVVVVVVGGGSVGPSAGTALRRQCGPVIVVLDTLPELDVAVIGERVPDQLRVLCRHVLHL